MHCGRLRHVTTIDGRNVWSTAINVCECGGRSQTSNIEECYMAVDGALSRPTRIFRPSPAYAHVRSRSTARYDSRRPLRAINGRSENAMIYIFHGRTRTAYNGRMAWYNVVWTPRICSTAKYSQLGPTDNICDVSSQPTCRLYVHKKSQWQETRNAAKQGKAKEKGSRQRNRTQALHLYRT